MEVSAFSPILMINCNEYFRLLGQFGFSAVQYAQDNFPYIQPGRPKNSFSLHSSLCENAATRPS